MAVDDAVDRARAAGRGRRAGRPGSRRLRPATTEAVITDESTRRLRRPWVRPMRRPPATTTAVSGSSRPAEAVVVAAHGDDRRDGLEVVEHRGDAQVAGVEDQVAALERLQDAVRQRVEVLADVAVGDDADPARPPGVLTRRSGAPAAARATASSTSRSTRSG